MAALARPCTSTRPPGDTVIVRGADSDSNRSLSAPESAIANEAVPFVCDSESAGTPPPEASRCTLPGSTVSTFSVSVTPSTADVTLYVASDSAAGAGGGAVGGAAYVTLCVSRIVLAFPQMSEREPASIWTDAGSVALAASRMASESVCDVCITVTAGTGPESYTRYIPADGVSAGSLRVTFSERVELS